MIFQDLNGNTSFAYDEDVAQKDIFDEDIRQCPVCGALYPEKFYINEDEKCVGCDYCISEADSLYEM